MKALGLILTGLLLAGFFAPRAAAADSIALGAAAEVCSPIAKTPQYRYRRYRRHYWQHRQVSPTPEPATLSLLGLGGLGLAYSSRRKKKKQDLQDRRQAAFPPRPS